MDEGLREKVAYIMLLLLLVAARAPAAHSITRTSNLTIFVDCSSNSGGGSVANSGASPSSAFSTLPRALTALAARPLPQRQATVMVSGTCHQLEPLELNAAHAHATFVGVGLAPTISGGLSVPPASWSAVGDGSPLWTAQLDALASAAAQKCARATSSVDCIAQLLPAQMWVGVNRRHRARYPNLFGSPGGGLSVYPWMRWDKALCPTLSVEPCATEAKYGMYWSSADDAVVKAVVDDPGRQLQAVTYVAWTTSRHYVNSANLSSE
jgi:hypothetical protein